MIHHKKWITHASYVHQHYYNQKEDTKNFIFLIIRAHFTQWTLVDQTVYSYYKFQLGKKVYVRKVIITVLLKLHPVHRTPHLGSTTLLRGFTAVFRRSLRHIAVCIKVAVPTDTQHTDTQKRCHSTKMILINGTNKTLSN